MHSIDLYIKYLQARKLKICISFECTGISTNESKLLLQLVWAYCTSLISTDIRWVCWGLQNPPP